jgi:L-fuconolactonase
VSGLPTVDSHLHLWSLGRSRYGWLDSVPELKRDFTAGQARAELGAAGVAEAILVQADDTLEDTGFLLETATAEPWIRGVVGWIQLDSPARARTQLDRWLEAEKFCGVRHLVHDDPRDDFLALAPVRESLALLAAAGLPLDVPDAFPRHLGATAALAAAIPELTVVVDHLGKPPLAAPDAMARWRRELAACAARPNTVAKLSGLHSPGTEYTVSALAPVFHEALELFGPARLMYGGDWPVSVISGGYQPTWQVLKELIETLSPGEQADVLAATSHRVYRRGTVV